VKLLDGPTHQDIVIRNVPPQIVSLDLTKGSVGVRRANPGDTLRATVKVIDPDGDTLRYRWTDDNGRALGLTDVPYVDWPLINGSAVNTLHVQVSDGNGGFAVARRSLRSGPDELLFAGTVFNRQDHTPVDKAQVTLNDRRTQTDAAGRFQVTVRDAARFVLNINKAGFALSSRVYYGRNTGLQIPLDPVVKGTVNGRNGGRVALAPDTCRTKCTLDECRKLCQAKASGAQAKECDNVCRSRVELQLDFDPGALLDASDQPYTGTATVEALQYDTSLSNPIPGDQGAISQNKTVRLATFGAFYIQPRDANGVPLRMAANKKVAFAMPIETRFLAKAPPKIPFFHYDEGKGMWIEEGMLTRSGDRYIGEIAHFSAFNADTMFAGSACVKVILDPASFTLPVSLDATYVDPSNGTFNHNGTQATDNIVGIERMPPNVNFTLEIRDASNNTVLQTVTLNSGPPLDPALFPDGSVSDPNFDACNGPVTVYSGNLPTGPTYLMPVTGGSIQDNSTDYQTATNAGAGGNRETFPLWLMANGFPDNSDAHAIYFNNGDLKFGRDMHCRVTNAGTTACYVSNYGDVGTDDSVTALSLTRAGGLPVATVAMEYDPSAPAGEAVQFWAYKGDATGSYLAKPTLDGQGAKPIPDMCLACHGGYYDSATHKVKNAVFLPFDLDSFVYDAQGDPHGVSASALAVQEQFRRLNKAVSDIHPDTLSGDTTNSPFTQLMNVWYPGGVNNSGSTFAFNTGSSQIGNFTGHEPLYDNVVKVVCRTCHIARSSADDWTKFTEMNSLSPSIQGYACGGGTPANHATFNFAMPHAEVPFKRFWQNALSSTVDSELSLPAPGCPNQ
jgi:hypothetical protein